MAENPGPPHQGGNVRHHLLDSENMQCALCLEPFTNAVTTSCGHTYCANCILTYWQTKSPNQKIDCPQDRVKVSLMIPNFVIRSELSKIDPRFSQDGAKFDRLIDQYNNQFSEAPMPFGDRLREDVALLRRASNESDLHRYVVIGLFILVVLYIILPVDLIPDDFGVVGFVDDFAIFFFVMVVLYMIAETYRRSLIDRGHQH
eukprot:TRINITY_DN14995_c0_g1_i1.p1 TRINITY_DN14995_c0_g1~~TRINITY_DN14995_c0_g1_i1.p1  ORF type:complete len:213 (+),score=28.05 TRINITY_DN14995_c0_g1_i1:36-641(+)